MATYAEMFGKSDKNWLKINKEDQRVETIYLDYKRVPQRGEHGKPKWMVQVEDEGKWAPKEEGTFDIEQVAGAFLLETIELELQVDGEVMYHTLSRSACEAFESEMKKTGGIKKGDTLGIWLVSTAKKPYTWKFAVVRENSE